MSDEATVPVVVSEVTCCIHHQLYEPVLEQLRSLGVHSVLHEGGRTVRLRRRRRGEQTYDQPAEVLRFVVAPKTVVSVFEQLYQAVGMSVRGRGSFHAQQCTEHILASTAHIPMIGGLNEHTLPDTPPVATKLALITCVLSTKGSAERVAELALEMGTGVPLVTLGTGTGMRDRLGLLRITVPPEKELVQVVVPLADTEVVIRQIVEEGRLDGPGKGFVFSTPVQEGVLDTLIRSGTQQHAASMEQVVAALDRLNQGTDWRRRFTTDHAGTAPIMKRLVHIAFVCAEERSQNFIEAAQHAGATGATSARVERIVLSEERARDSARERCTLTVSAADAPDVLEAMLGVAVQEPQWLDSLQSMPVPVAYSYRTWVAPNTT